MFNLVTKSLKVLYLDDHLISVGFRVPQEELFRGMIKVIPEVSRMEEKNYRGGSSFTMKVIDHYQKIKYTKNHRSTDNLNRFLGNFNRKLEHCKLLVSGDAGLEGSLTTVFVMIGYIECGITYQWTNLLEEVEQIKALGEMAKQEIKDLLSYDITSSLQIFVYDPPEDDGYY
jgi:hypothetical protein